MYSSHRNRSKSSQKVIVIGAGPSGIGAARILHEQGLTPIVLEARDRIGGRVVGQKLYANLVDQDCAKDDANYVNIQMGANWIHGLDAEVNPFYPIAKKLNLELHQTSSDDEPGEDVLLFDGGHDGENDHSRKNMIRVTKDEYHIVLKRYEWIKSKYFDDLFRFFDGEDYFHCHQGKVSLFEAFEAAIIASESSSELGPCSYFHRRCLNWLFDRVAIDMACPLQGVSVQNYMEGDSSGMYGEATIVNAGGMSSILHHLAHPEEEEEEGHAAATTALDIRLNMIVERIELIDSPVQDSNEEEEEVLSTFNVGSLETHVFPYLSASSFSHHPTTSSTQKTKKMVRIICANNFEFIVDFVILTVPISLLTQPTIKEDTMGKITFSPEPPLAISRLSSTLKLGLMNLIWIWFPVTFWEEGFNFFGVARSSSCSQQHSCVAASKDGKQRYYSEEASAEDEEQEEARVDIVGIDKVNSRYPKLEVAGQEVNFLSCSPENCESSRAQLNFKYSPSVHSSASSPLSPSSNKENKSSNKSQQETEEEEEEETTFTTFLAPKVLDRYGNLQPVLMAQVIGPFAERCETIPEHVLADMVVQKLREMFGDEKVPDAIGCARSTWRSDPFARGSWSYFPHHDTPVSATATAAADDKVNGVIGLDNISGVYSRDAGTTITDIIAVAANANAAAASFSIVTTAGYNSTAVGDTTIASSEDYLSLTSSSSSSSTSSGSLSESGGDTLSMESSSLLPPNAAKGPSSAMTAATTNDLWDGHVLYAGEATNLQLRGSAHGAYLAGIKAAEAILKRIQEEEVQNK